MRFSCRIFLENAEGALIPPDYRRSLLSLIKETLKLSSKDGPDFFNQCYADNRLKPFTFSAYIPMQKAGNNFKLQKRTAFFSLFFSTSDYEFLMRVYNGLNKIKDENPDFTLFGKAIKAIKQFYLFPERRFEKDEITFKTLSPFLVRDTKDGDYYLVPEASPIYATKKFAKWKNVPQNIFIEALRTSLCAQIEQLLGSKIDIEVKDIKVLVVPVVHGSANKVHQFTITYPAMKGTVLLKTRPEVLKLIYDIGIGARRSEGFGMLEIVD